MCARKRKRASRRTSLMFFCGRRSADARQVLILSGLIFFLLVVAGCTIFTLILRLLACVQVVCSMHCSLPLSLYLSICSLTHSLTLSHTHTPHLPSLLSFSLFLSLSLSRSVSLSLSLPSPRFFLFSLSLFLSRSLSLLSPPAPLSRSFPKFSLLLKVYAQRTSQTHSRIRMHGLTQIVDREDQGSDGAIISVLFKAPYDTMLACKVKPENIR